MLTLIRDVCDVYILGSVTYLMPSSTYHHGDLRAACVRAAIELLEEDGNTAGLSLRAVARRAGVSPGAPYRHYADRDALVSAVAAVGYRELADCMAAPNPSPSTPEDLADLGLAYVEFALRRPALFRLMFGEPCERENKDRVAATAAIWELVSGAARACFPGTDVEAMSNALWSLVHGLAFLHLDGKFDTASPHAVSDRVRAAILGIVTAYCAEST
ncbi:TetR family transcriptional regulator [Mycobacterium kubicae]|uniref:TetR family transcriptional regulator n=2 Tax=Mycobacterium kubicae TaxID=120959 RepID=A0ABQ1BHH8_9MYCO|nr:TetR family transcriptional regulator [Mycobacterium kubicae]